MQRRNRHTIVFCCMLIVLMLSGCRRERAFMDYAHVSSDGWRRSDTLHFSIPRMKEAGDYCLFLGLRSDNDYPYMNASVIVEQKLMPEGHVFVDTVKIDLTRSNGRSRGTGVNLYQFMTEVDTLYLDVDDSLEISIRHDIKTDTLRGISDVGVELMK